MATKNHTFLPTVTFTKGGRRGILATRFLTSENDRDKDAFADIVVQLRRDCEAVCFYMEAWVSNLNREQYDSGKYLQPSKDPKRKEAAIVNLYVKDRTVAFQAGIKREPNGLTDWEVMIDTAKGETMDGRFA